jgi:opacity protein-like surface antigen
LIFFHFYTNIDAESFILKTFDNTNGKRGVTMKKLSVVFLLLLLCWGSLFSQSATKEIQLSWGLITIQDLAELGKSLGAIIGNAIGSGIVDLILGPGSADRLDHMSTQGYGTFILGYNYSPGRLKFGLLASYTHYRVNYIFQSGKTARDLDHFITGMARLDYKWINGSAVKLYSGVGAGICYYHSKGTSAFTSDVRTNNEIFFAFQVNALGIRLGKKLGFFIELGLGYNGIINGGLSLEF